MCRALSASRQRPPLWSCWKSSLLFLDVSRSCRSGVYNGLIIGAQGGSQRSFDIVDRSLEKGHQGLRPVVSGLVRQAGDQLWQAPPVGLALPQGDVPPICPGTLKSSTPGAFRFLGYIQPVPRQGRRTLCRGQKTGRLCQKGRRVRLSGRLWRVLLRRGGFHQPGGLPLFKDEVIKK